jgi:hypothetical protein
MTGKECSKPIISFPEIATVEERISDGFSLVEPLAVSQVDEIRHPLPEGFDYLPSSFFLLACRSFGIMSKGIISIACSIEALSIAFKAILSLMYPNESQDPHAPGHQHSEGMTLLLADGLILLSHKFLSELDSRELQSIAPLLVKRAREWTGKIDSWGNAEEGLLKIQRSLSKMALEAVHLLVMDTDDSMEVIEDLTIQVDLLLSKYRDSEDKDERGSVIRELEELSRSLSAGEERCLPLCYYVSLISDRLTPTS